jgi:metacaspase-1
MTSLSRRVLALTFLMTAGVGAGTAFSQTKRALIIAIGEYPRPEVTGYRLLHSANDIPLIQGALERHGFRRTDIRLLQDSDAKRDGIFESLQTLRDQSRPGDYVVIHYSGHGHRLTDDSGDESDGYDEVLVPYGASANVGPGYDGSGHIRDDDFGKAIRAIGLRVQEGGRKGQVLVLVDACFSGSITRSLLPVRGSKDPIGPPGMSQMIARKQGETRDALLDGAGRMPESVVLMTATRFGELDHEVQTPDGTTVGPLSLAFSRAMMGLETGATYQVLYELIRMEMSRIARYQQPTAEGNLGVPVLGGAVSDPVVYHRVVEASRDSMVVIDGGVLSGVGAGSRVRFARPSSGGFSAIAHGRVTASRDLESDVVAYGTPSDSLLGSLVFVTERVSGGTLRSVFLSNAGSGARRALSDALASAEGGQAVRLTALEEQADYRLDALPDGRLALYLGVRRPGARPLRIFDGDEAGGLQAAQFLKAIVLGEFLGSVELRDPALTMEIEFRPASLRIIEQWPEPPTCRPTEADTTDHTATRNGSASWTVDVNQGYLLALKNRSTEALYANVLLLQADGGIEPLYPAKSAADNYFPPGSEFLIPQCFMATGEEGTSVIKLFATRAPLNLADVLAGIEAGTRAQRSGAGSFEAALRNAAGTRTRSGDNRPATGITRSILLVGRDS